MSSAVRIAIIDDNKSIRTSLGRLLKSAGFDCAIYSSAEEFLAGPAPEQTDCVVTDMIMRELDGLELQQKLSSTAPHLSVVFITGHGDVSSSVRAMKAGAIDFLEKPVDGDMLIGSITRAVEQSRRSKAAHLEVLDLQRRFSTLTPREREVFALVTEGLLNKQVGAELGTSEKTVKVQRARVVEKMRAASLADLVRMAQRLGLHSTAEDAARGTSQDKQPKTNAI
jgi:FixJ family two-component response regulator